MSYCARGISYYQLARRSGVDHTVYLRPRDGKTESITFRALEGICQALNCTPNDLFKLVPDKRTGTKNGSKKRGGKK